MGSEAYCGEEDVDVQGVLYASRFDAVYNCVGGKCPCWSFMRHVQICPEPGDING